MTASRDEELLAELRPVAFAIAHRMLGSISEAAEDPARQAEIADSPSLAMLVLLESLSPEQRAVLLLRDVFDSDYGEIAAIVGKNEANVREVNDQPGALLLDGGGRVIAVWALDVLDGQIQGISSVVNPDKLRHLGPVADYWQLLKRRAVCRTAGSGVPSTGIARNPTNSPSVGTGGRRSPHDRAICRPTGANIRRI